MASETTARDSGTVQDAAAPTAQKFRFSLAYGVVHTSPLAVDSGLNHGGACRRRRICGPAGTDDEIEQDIRFRNAPPRIFGSNSEYWSTQDYSQAMFRAEGSGGEGP